MRENNAGVKNGDRPHSRIGRGKLNESGNFDLMQGKLVVCAQGCPGKRDQGQEFTLFLHTTFPLI